MQYDESYEPHHVYEIDSRIDVEEPEHHRENVEYQRDDSHRIEHLIQNAHDVEYTIL